ncbi:carbon-nitrogen hydrolase [Catenaria anguillulae PL171]|uniref:Carbon-nitrogen hydrolase n=1 Tax=Catenaria anguillulae PL171 TaxID=765915 RepID=A0A1Y2I6M4_9FUNG|nr:carbon-nitrogen hydrolase [Catenaria anguillulae PL171]
MASSSLFFSASPESSSSAAAAPSPRSSSPPPSSTSADHATRAKSTIKIAMVQLNPYHKQPQRTLDHLNSLLASCFPSLASSDDTSNDGEPPIDILMLPEMALTGYTYTSPSDIHPYAEPLGPEGRTTSWCMSTASRLHCWVVAGFPCLAPDGKYYNAMVLVNRRGEIITTYFKHFLYTTDEAWATPGPSFKALVDIPEFGHLVLGICMDLNPYKFEAPFDLCEFGRFCVSKRAHLVLCCMAWLRSGSSREGAEQDDQDEDDEDEDEASSLLSYWAYRLRPLDGTGCLVAICNRVGKENSTEFAGHSCVMQMSGGIKQRDMEVSHVGKKEGVYVIEAEFDWVNQGDTDEGQEGEGAGR